MKTTNAYLDAAKTVLRLESDRALQRHFGWSPSHVSTYRSGKSALSNEHATQLAVTLGINPLLVIADMEAERAKDDEKRLFWANIAKKYAGIAAAVLLVSTLMALDAKPAYSATVEGEHFILCKKCSHSL